MKVLLLAMPNFSRYFTAHSYPNLGICSLAAHIEDADVKVLDLRQVPDPDAAVRTLMREYDPDVVGLSAMAFQYHTACDIANKVKLLKPSVRTVLGGYHATTGYKHIGQSREARLFDFLAKGEQEYPFNDLIAALKCGDTNYERIGGLSYWRGGQLHHNPLPENVDLARIKLPARHKRLKNDFIGWGERVDLIETTRGCTLPCTYCSITRMYGRSFRQYSIDRIIEDVQILRSQGVQKVFIVDDNITLDVPRFKVLLQRLLDEKIQMKWHVQATVVGIASDEELVEMMAKVGFVQTFLGIESLSKDVLKYFKKGGVKNTTVRAVNYLQKHGIRILGGFIIGSPEDTRESIRDLVDQIVEMDIDLPYLQILTPYPGTAQREELVRLGLVTNENDFSQYDGNRANIKTNHLSSKELLRAQHLAFARLYLDPRLRPGRLFYKGLLEPHVPRTLWTWLKEIARQVTRRAEPVRYEYLDRPVDLETPVGPPSALAAERSKSLPLAN
jgi:radical SAM superfamily enzyme YgiQ (UPF0313 family)